MNWLTWLIRIAFAVAVFLLLWVFYALPIPPIWKVLVGVGLYLFGTVAPPERVSNWVDATAIKLGIKKQPDQKT